MQKRRKIIPLVLVLLTTLMLSGCFEGTFHVTVNEDGSADLEYKLGVNEEVVGFMGSEDDNPIATAEKDLTREGFTITSFNENGLVGIVAQKHVEKIETIPAFGKLEFKSNDDQSTFRMHNRFFQTMYKLHGEIDLTEVNSGTEGNDPYAEALLSQMKLDFILTLPTKSEKHNASSITADGRTLTWNLVLGSKNSIQSEASTTKTTNVILVVLGSIVILLILAFSILRSKKSTGLTTVVK